jgi:hypothetical protein
MSLLDLYRQIELKEKELTDLKTRYQQLESKKTLETNLRQLINRRPVHKVTLDLVNKPDIITASYLSFSNGFGEAKETAKTVEFPISRNRSTLLPAYLLSNERLRVAIIHQHFQFELGRNTLNLFINSDIGNDSNNRGVEIYDSGSVKLSKLFAKLIRNRTIHNLEILDTPYEKYERLRFQTNKKVFDGFGSVFPDVESLEFDNADGRNYFRVNMHDLMELSKLPKLKKLQINLPGVDEGWKQTDFSFDHVESLSLRYDDGWTGDPQYFSVPDVHAIMKKFPKLGHLTFNGSMIVDPLVIPKFNHVTLNIPYFRKGDSLLLVPVNYDLFENFEDGIIVGSVNGGTHNVWSVYHSNSEIERILRKLTGSREVSIQKALTLFEKTPNFRAFPAYFIESTMSAEETKAVVEEEAEGEATEQETNKKLVKKGYIGIHSSGFRDFLLKSELLLAITDFGLEHPSEVQKELIPQAVLGMDIICQAKSGVGKTTVFVLAVLQQLVTVENQVDTLVLCHTRELAYHIYQEFLRFSKYLTDVKVKVFFGGIKVKLHVDILAEESPHVVIGTPGRILQLVNDKHLKLDNLKRFILDECDKMIGNASIAMMKDVQTIFRATPREKQVMMFSDTLSKDGRPIYRKFTQHPVELYCQH